MQPAQSEQAQQDRGASEQHSDARSSEPASEPGKHAKAKPEPGPQSGSESVALDLDSAAAKQVLRSLRDPQSNSEFSKKLRKQVEAALAGGGPDDGSPGPGYSPEVEAILEDVREGKIPGAN